MSDQQSAYDAKVREIAEEMAQLNDRYNYRMLAEVFCDYERLEGLIKEYFPCARIAVKHMAEEAVKAFKSATTTAYRLEHVDKLSESYLHENGLVPPKPNENE